MVVPDIQADGQKDMSQLLKQSPESGLGNLFIGRFCNNQYHSEIIDQENDLSELFSSFTTMESQAAQNQQDDPLFLRYHPCLYFWRHGGEVFHGTFIRGVQHGYGQLTNYMDGSRVTSYLSSGARIGLGTFERQTDFYTGLYNNDKSEGVGIYQLNRNVPVVSGDQLENELVDSRHNHFAERYVGQWHDGCYEGWGIQQTSQSAKGIHVGQFSRDQKAGQNFSAESTQLDSR